MKKYKDYLHKIKSNYFIINSIKNKYELIKRYNKEIFYKNNFDSKVEELNKIKIDNNSNNNDDNVYFQHNFAHKNLCNSFIYFTQVLRSQKSNKTHFSKNSLSPHNQSFPQLSNSKEETKEDTKDNTMYNNNINISTENNEKCEILNNNENKLEENDLLIDTDLREYTNYLEKIKENFKNSYGNIYIKNKLGFECIVNALFKGDLSGVVSNDFINDEYINFFDLNIAIYLENLKNIPKAKLKGIDHMEKLFNNIKSDDFLIKAEKIVKSLSIGRKYKNLIENLKKTKNKSVCGDIVEKLKNAGGFDAKIAKLVLQIIIKYISTYETIINIEKEIGKMPKYREKYSQLSFEISQLKAIKEFINSSNDKLEGKNSILELNEIETIKNNFQKYSERFINQEENDEEYKNILKEIQSFTKDKDVKTIIESLSSLLKDDEYDFYVDDSFTLSTYCWGIQNGQDLVFNY